MTHPTEASLALYAGGELGLWDRWKISRHITRCGQCRACVEEFRSAKEELRSLAAALPSQVNWGRLAAEMKANIHLGLEAGQCVGPEEAAPAVTGWRLASVFAPAVILIVLGFWLQQPRPRPAARAWVDGTLLESTGEGIELRQGDRMLSLQHPGAGDVTYLVNVQGTLRARYVDSETLQVTIQNVYAQ